MTHSAIRARVKDIALLFKLRLTFIVVVSAVLGFLLTPAPLIWSDLLMLILGGFLVTGASNSINQILERDLDALMDRTSDRPLPSGRMSVPEALWIGIGAALTGIFLLWYFLNPLSGILGALAFFIYTLAYTPLKRITPLAVFVGAIPGAIPPMLGWVAVTGDFGPEPGALFAMQFMWQFPHFWAIAWVMDTDYRKAGFRLLPSREGKTKGSAFQVLLYSLFMLPAALLPWMFGVTGVASAIFSAVCGLLFLFQAWKLFRGCEDKDAKRLMFASFLYLPVVQLAYVLDKI